MAILLLFSSACHRQGLRNRVVSSGYRGAYEVSLVSFSQGFAVTWYDTRNGNAEIYLALLRPDGELLSGEIRITANDTRSYEPHLAWSGETFGLAWYEVPEAASDHGGDGGTSMFAVLSEEGLVRRALILDDEDAITRNPLVLTDGNIFCVAWLKESRLDRSVFVMARLFDLDGQPLGGAVALGPASESTWNLNGVFIRGTGIKIVFDASLGTLANELFMIEVDPDLKIAKQVRLTADDGVNSKYPDLYLEGSRLGFVWWEDNQGSNEVFFSLWRSSELPLEPRRLTNNHGDSTGAYLAGLDGRFAVAWSDDTSGNYEIYLALIDPDIDVEKSRFLQVTKTRYSSRTPSIARHGNCLGLAWNEMRENSIASIKSVSKIYFQAVCDNDWRKAGTASSRRLGF